MTSSFENLERWMRHSAMSDPGGHDTAKLPSGIGALNALVQGIIVHTEWLAVYGLNASDFARVSRDTLPVADRLAPEENRVVFDDDHTILGAIAARPEQPIIDLAPDW